jgi:hypothetical protein
MLINEEWMGYLETVIGEIRNAYRSLGAETLISQNTVTQKTEEGMMRKYISRM